MNNVDAVKSLYKKHHIETGLTIRGDCEKDLSGVLLENGDSLAFTFDDVLAEKTKLQAEFKSQEYARNRQPDYPPIGDQLDALYHAGVFPKEMADKLKAVKDKYTKPE